ncbi:MAG: hypothetical protein MUF00_01605 [Gemmatimonadaceae bacterium]|jgi:hypothetical protein|nr:hypothetical protein [Gemmatimonadaceae bacterium]
MDPEVLRYLQMLGMVPDLSEDAPSVGERASAVMRGVAEGATGSWVDEIAGALAQSVNPYARATLGRLIAPEGQEDRYAQAAMQTGYTEVRDAARRQQREAMQRSPGDALAGQVAGSLLGARVMPLPRAAGATESIARGLGAGTAIGAGASEADTVEGVAQDAAIGGAIGGGAGAVGAGLGALVGSVDDAKTGRLLARLRQAGVSRVPQRRQVAGRQGVEGLLDTARDLERAGAFEGGGILPASTDVVASNIDDMAANAGRTLGSVRDTLADTPVDVSRLRSWMGRQLANVPQNSMARPVRKFWRDMLADLDDMEAAGPVTYRQLDELRSTLGAVTGPAMRSPRETIILDAQRSLYGQLADAQSAAAARAGMGDVYETARRQYDIGRRMGRATQQDAVAEASAGLTRLEAGMAGLGAAAGGPVGALTSMAGKRVAQSNRLPIMGALARESVARIGQATAPVTAAATRVGTAEAVSPEPEYTPDDEAALDALIAAPEPPAAPAAPVAGQDYTEDDEAALDALLAGD